MAIDVIDVSLVTRAQNGDTLALEHLCERCRAVLYGSCLDMLQDPWMAEDATHNILEILLHNLSKLEHPHMFPRWLWVTAKRMCYAVSKQTRREPFIHDVVSSQAIGYILGESPC